ncbi:hypothetical protein A9Q99_26905 [Gammaproteobacteria bacterium 45_16_T64]|nr:hypothetical protein A9Q99_26905 [Gammaproteobacteria bacterium 45_16_T64]
MEEDNHLDKVVKLNAAPDTRSQNDDHKHYFADLHVISLNTLRLSIYLTSANDNANSHVLCE